MRALLRLAGLDDATAFAGLRRAVLPFLVGTPAGVRHWWRTTSAAAALRVLVAEVGGAIVGAAHASLNTWTSEVGAASISVLVHPDHRRRGIGGQLYAALEEHLRDHGARRLQG